MRAMLNSSMGLAPIGHQNARPLNNLRIDAILSLFVIVLRNYNETAESCFVLSLE
jgi:hypothetical protein